MAQVRGRRQYNTRSSRIKDNVLESIIFVNPDLREAGFLTLMSRLKSKRTHQEKFEWDIQNHLATSTQLNGAVASTTQKTLTVDDASIFRSNDLYRNSRTEEIIRVESVDTSNNQVVATRQYTYDGTSGTAAANMNDNDVLYRLGPAVGEDNRRQSFVSRTPSSVFNYTQIMRYDLSMSRRQQKREFENDDEMPLIQKLAIEEARKDMNSTFIFGEKSRKTVNGEDITTTQGMWGVPTSHVLSVGGTLYEYPFDEFLAEEAFRDGRKEKVALASTQFLLALSEMTKDRSNVFYQGTTDVGMFGIPVNAMKYKSPNGGILTVVEDRALTESENGSFLILDESQLSKMVFSNNGIDDDFSIIDDTQDKDDLGMNKTIYADIGIQYGAEEFHAKGTGVTAGASGRAI